MSGIDMSALALFRRFQPRFRKITWQYVGNPVYFNDTGRRRDVRETWHGIPVSYPAPYPTDGAFCFIPAHVGYGPCDDAFTTGSRTHDHLWPQPEPGDLIVYTDDLHNFKPPPFKYASGDGCPAQAFDRFLQKHILTDVLSKYVFLLDVVRTPTKKGGSSPTFSGFPDHQTARISIEDHEKVPGINVIKGHKDDDEKTDQPKPWHFFIPKKSVEGKAMKLAIELEKPGKISELKAIEAKLLKLLAMAA